jgi:hypothetical protein
LEHGKKACNNEEEKRSRPIGSLIGDLCFWVPIYWSCFFLRLAMIICGVLWGIFCDFIEIFESLELLYFVGKTDNILLNAALNFMFEKKSLNSQTFTFHHGV